MDTKEYYVLAFNSTHEAIRTESLLKRQGIAAEMIPTPRDIDVSCGLSIRFSEHAVDRIMDIIDSGTDRVRLYWGMRTDGKTIHVEKKI